MAMDVDQLLRLQVNREDWAPNKYLIVPRRFFKRPDGYVFAFPITEDWHIRRVLGEGYTEVEGPQHEAPEIAQRVQAQQSRLAAAVASRHAAEDPRDKQISILMASVEQMTKLVEAMTRAKEAGNGDSAGDAADHRQGARTHR